MKSEEREKALPNQQRMGVDNERQASGISLLDLSVPVKACRPMHNLNQKEPDCEQ